MLAELAIAMFSNRVNLRNIEFQCNNNPSCMKTDLFELWLDGNGLAPYTWRTLIQVLRDISLNRLAEEIESIITNRRSLSRDDNHWIKSGYMSK